MLKRENLNKWVQGMVYFTNNKCEVNLHSTKIPVFSSAKDGDLEILKYITNYKRSNIYISDKDKLEIVRILSYFCEVEVEVEVEVENVILDSNTRHDYNMQ